MRGLEGKTRAILNGQNAIISGVTLPVDGDCGFGWTPNGLKFAFDQTSFVNSATTTPPAAILDPTTPAQALWVLTGGWPTATSQANLYGLGYLTSSLMFAESYSPWTRAIVSPGDPLSLGSSSIPFQSVQQPTLALDSYYFSAVNLFTGAASGPIPGGDTFDATQSQPVIICGVGQPLLVGGWAKYHVNGVSSGKSAYLGQYFAKAEKMDANGQKHLSGTLSEYGEFFPTETGHYVLTTMPDALGLGNTGTCDVYVIGLQLDANHDGAMDPTFTGPDSTSPGQPFRFWINNDHDEPGTGGNADQDLDMPSAPDYRYGRIRCARNLEDFARLWVNCLPPLLASQGYSITLNLTTFNGNPAINLYAANDPAGGTGYLTDPSAAQQQFTQQFINGQLIFDFAQQLKTLRDGGQTYTFPLGGDGTPAFTHFLFEGAGIGTAELDLTISQCHRADQNRPPVGTSKPASPRREIHNSFVVWFKECSTVG